jgi:hypothetical protein
MVFGVLSDCGDVAAFLPHQPPTTKHQTPNTKHKTPMQKQYNTG